MTRKLIIHIGSHKTGTSSIQHTLLKNKAVLQKQGFTLFNQGPDGMERKSGNALTWIKFKLKREHRIEGKIRKGLPQALAAAGNNVIISAETFSWVFSEKEIQKFQRKLSAYFDDIKIVAYIRRQDQQAVSHYQQASKHGAFVAARFYNGGTRALPSYKEYFQKYLNYHQRLCIWAEAFGDEAMIVRVFEGSQLKNGDAVDDFFHATGLKRETASIRKNESSGFEKTKMGHLISEQEFSRPVWRTLTKYLNDTGKIFPSRKEASSFYANFKNSNKWLNEKFSLNDENDPFNNNFDMYPMEANDQWTEASANQAIHNLLAGVKDLLLLEHRDAEFLKQCAHKLEATDPNSSIRLTELSDKYGVHNGIKDRVRSQIKSYLRK